MAQTQDSDRIASLIGLWFHEMVPDPDREGRKVVGMQGQIIGALGDSMYLLRCYEHIEGNPDAIRVVHLETMLMDWRFYETNQEMLDWYDDFSASRYGTRRR